MHPDTLIKKLAATPLEASTIPTNVSFKSLKYLKINFDISFTLPQNSYKPSRDL